MKGKGILEFAKGLLAGLQGMTRTQAIGASIAAVLAVGGIGTGGYLVYQHNQEQPQQQQVTADIVLDTEPVYDLFEDLTETTELWALEPTELATETETAEVEANELTLVGTSIERDLKIKVQNQKSRLVTGESFLVNVKQDKKGAKAKQYKDDDKDGIIYISELEAGSYTVELEAIEGYDIKKGMITVKVKDKIAYEKVDVTAEIKAESQVNVAVEDTAINNVPVEATQTDTVSLIASTMTPVPVDKAEVDTTAFTKASASTDNNTVECKKTVKVPGSTEGTEETEKPTETQKPTETEKTTETEKPTETENATQSTDAQTADDIASVDRNRVARVGTGTAAADSAVVAKISVPKQITLYDCSNAASNSYTAALAISGEESIIQSIAWASKDTSVVTVTATNNGKSVTVKGVKKGTANIEATITYIADEKGTTASVVLQSTVKVSDLSDSTVQLKDKSGNLLYLDKEATKPATAKDYSTTTTFYAKPLYTGWQTIDGKVYYYDANHKALTGDQIIGGVKYTFASDGSLSQSSGSRGIDVSKYQGNIDWGAVASSGISFAIIRAGYRGSSTGALIEDPYFKRNISGATKAGIKVGVYFFTQAISEAEAVEEASMALSLVSGYKVTYPIFIDTESATNGRANGLDVNTRTAVVRAFCQTIQNGGYKAGIYASKNWYNTKLNTSTLNGYCIWVAQYNTSCTYSGKYDMWQYSSKGSVAGISGNVDMNISYLGY